MRMKYLFLTLILVLGAQIFNGCGGSSNKGGGGDIDANPPSSKLSLNVTVTGVGTGKVTSNIGNISCSNENSGTCSTSLPPKTEVVLTAQPDPGYNFLGWYGGDCHGKLSCTITLNQAKQVKAAFAMLVYVSDVNFKSFNIWRMKTDGSEKIALTQLNNASSFSPQWSPDGTKIVYVSHRSVESNYPDQFGSVNNIFVTNVADGSKTEALTKLQNSSTTSPQWSSDGNKIFYESARSVESGYPDTTNNSFNIFMVNLADGLKTDALTNSTMENSDSVFDINIIP